MLYVKAVFSTGCNVDVKYSIAVILKKSTSLMFDTCQNQIISPLLIKMEQTLVRSPNRNDRLGLHCLHQIRHFPLETNVS